MTTKRVKYRVKTNARTSKNGSKMTTKTNSTEAYLGIDIVTQLKKLLLDHQRFLEKPDVPMANLIRLSGFMKISMMNCILCIWKDYFPEEIGESVEMRDRQHRLQCMAGWLNGYYSIFKLGPLEPIYDGFYPTAKYEGGLLHEAGLYRPSEYESFMASRKQLEYVVDMIFRIEYSTQLNSPIIDKEIILDIKFCRVIVEELEKQCVEQKDDN